MESSWRRVGGGASHAPSVALVVRSVACCSALCVDSVLEGDLQGQGGVRGPWSESNDDYTRVRGWVAAPWCEILPDARDLSYLCEPQVMSSTIWAPPSTAPPPTASACTCPWWPTPGGWGPAWAAVVRVGASWMVS